MLDTRAGRWLLIGIGAVIAVALTIMFFNQGGQHPFGDYLQATTMPMALILPVVGILAVTSEWSRARASSPSASSRAACASPGPSSCRRSLVGVAAFALSLVLAALAHQAAITFRGITGDWSIERARPARRRRLRAARHRPGCRLRHASSRTRPAAVVVFFVLPTAWAILGRWSRGWAMPPRWLDMNQTMQPLFEGSLTGEQWAHLGTSVAVWVILRWPSASGASTAPR